MFKTLTPIPPDPILGLTEAFKKDPNPNKVNLGAGVYRDAQGRTPILRCVREAERRILENEESKTYLPIDGLPGLADVVQGLVFGPDHPIITDKRAATVQAPGRTGALRIAGDFLARIRPDVTVWVSEPTWPTTRSGSFTPPSSGSVTSFAAYAPSGLKSVAKFGTCSFRSGYTFGAPMP